MRCPISPRTCKRRLQGSSTGNRSLIHMSDVSRTIEAVWKIESTRLIAAIARVTHDIGIAEELAQDALVTALELWPEEGIPENPGAWPMTAAKRRAIDSLRRGRMLVQKHEEIARELEWQQQSKDPAESLPTSVQKSYFMLSRSARAVLDTALQK